MIRMMISLGSCEKALLGEDSWLKQLGGVKGCERGRNGVVVVRAHVLSGGGLPCALTLCCVEPMVQLARAGRRALTDLYRHKRNGHGCSVNCRKVAAGVKLLRLEM